MVRPYFPDYGVFLQWPHPGIEWIHPEDVEAAERVIPSNRVFRREAYEAPYYRYRYGDLVLRLKPSMWLPLEGEGFDIGDQVETVGVGMQQDLFVARIRQRRYDRRRQVIYYRLQRGDQILSEKFEASKMRLLTEKVELRPAEQITIEPSDDPNLDPSLLVDDR